MSSRARSGETATSCDPRRSSSGRAAPTGSTTASTSCARATAGAASGHAAREQRGGLHLGPRRSRPHERRSAPRSRAPRGRRGVKLARSAHSRSAAAAASASSGVTAGGRRSGARAARSSRNAAYAGTSAGSAGSATACQLRQLAVGRRRRPQPGRLEQSGRLVEELSVEAAQVAAVPTGRHDVLPDGEQRAGEPRAAGEDPGPGLGVLLVGEKPGPLPPGGERERVRRRAQVVDTVLEASAHGGAQRVRGDGAVGRSMA